MCVCVCVYCEARIAQNSVWTQTRTPACTQPSLLLQCACMVVCVRHQGCNLVAARGMVHVVYADCQEEFADIYGIVAVHAQIDVTCLSVCAIVMQTVKKSLLTRKSQQAQQAQAGPGGGAHPAQGPQEPHTAPLVRAPTDLDMELRTLNVSDTHPHTHPRPHPPTPPHTQTHKHTQTHLDIGFPFACEDTARTHAHVCTDCRVCVCVCARVRMCVSQIASLDRELLGLSLIGKGGGGLVFRAVWQGAAVAVKFMIGESQCVCVSVFVCLSVCLSVCLPVCPPARPPACPSAQGSGNQTASRISLAHPNWDETYTCGSMVVACASGPAHGGAICTVTLHCAAIYVSWCAVYVSRVCICVRVRVCVLDRHQLCSSEYECFGGSTGSIRQPPARRTGVGPYESRLRVTLTSHALLIQLANKTE